MSEKRRTTVGAVALALGLAVLYFILTLTALHAVGTDGQLYYALQSREYELAWGISEADLRTLDGELSAYLAGKPNALTAPSEDGGEGRSVMALPVDGEVRPVFGQREMAHLEDCRALFALLRKVRSRLIPWAVLLIVGGAYLLADRRKARRAALLSPLILLIPLGAFAVWAAIDFDGAFTFFHRVLFTNDLWLLDPRTELLIRICPESMFRSMGLRVALWSLAAIAAVLGAALAVSAIWPRRKDDDSGAASGGWNDNRTARRAAVRKTFDFGGKP